MSYVTVIRHLEPHPPHIGRFCEILALNYAPGTAAPGAKIWAKISQKHIGRQKFDAISTSNLELCKFRD